MCVARGQMKHVPFRSTKGIVRLGSASSDHDSTHMVDATAALLTSTDNAQLALLLHSFTLYSGTEAGLHRGGCSGASP